MTYDQAMERLKAGTRLRREAWDRGRHVAADSGGPNGQHGLVIFDVHHSGASFSPYSPSAGDEEATDWEEFE